MEFIDKYFRDIIAFTILMTSLLSLIFKEDKTDSVSQSLGYVITGCLGYLFRGSKWKYLFIQAMFKKNYFRNKYLF